jgi:hypothetical protein
MKITFVCSYTNYIKIPKLYTNQNENSQSDDKLCVVCKAIIIEIN